MISNKDTSAGAVKLLSSAECYLDELVFVSKMLTTLGQWGLGTK